MENMTQSLSLNRPQGNKANGHIHTFKGAGEGEVGAVCYRTMEVVRLKSPRENVWVPAMLLIIVTPPWARFQKV